MSEKEDLVAVTPARIQVGRVGTRPTTVSWLNFRGDHARARDAIYSEMSEQFIQRMIEEYGSKLIQTTCTDRRDFILFPPRGKHCSQDCLDQLSKSCITGADVQIMISDGLSAFAVEANVPDLLPILNDGLKMEGLTFGTPIVVRYGRVAIGDQVAHHLKSKLVVNLIGERPGLSSSDSLSAYITLNPGPHTISSDRTVVSNIHKGGTPSLEAGAYIVQLVKKIFKLNLSGVKLQQAEA